jgi:nucleoside-diphosphate-sugar epimerase
MVLGGYGFVGAAVAAIAARRGYAVQAVGRREYTDVRGGCCNLLINANGNSRKYLSRQDPALDFQLSVQSVLHSLLDIEAEHYVFLSSIDVYNDVSNPAANAEDGPIDAARLSPYGFHKWLAEQLVRYHRPDALILRMGGLVGPGLWKNPLYDLLTGAALRVHPDSAYQYVSTGALAGILFDLLAAGCMGETFNVAGQGLCRVREMAALIPDSDLGSAPPDAVPERYEINTEKLARRLTVPQTAATVRTFIADVLADASVIGKPEAAL